MNETHKAFIDITEAQYQEASPVIEAAAAIKIASLEMQVKFLVDTFTRRDMENRILIEQYQQALEKQNLSITWFRAQMSKDVEQ